MPAKILFVVAIVAIDAIKSLGGRGSPGVVCWTADHWFEPTQGNVFVINCFPCLMGQLLV